MPAKLSHNPLNAQINKYYIIHVYEYKATTTVATEKGDKQINLYHPQQIVSAETLSRYVEDQKIKISLFNDVLDAGVDVYTRLIRKRLKIEFRSK
jgi:hypothetical protein